MSAYQRLFGSGGGTGSGKRVEFRYFDVSEISNDLLVEREFLGCASILKSPSAKILPREQSVTD